MEERPLVPESVDPLDGDDFMGAYQYAGMVASHEFIEEIPAIERPIIVDDNGTQMKWAKKGPAMFGLAAARHFRDDTDKYFSFMWRFWALVVILEDESIREFVRDSEDGSREVHPAVIEVAATFPLRPKDGFDVPGFLERVREVAEGMDV